MVDASWVIEDRNTGAAVLETTNFEAIQFINVKRYRVWPILYWLHEINRRARAVTV